VKQQIWPELMKQSHFRNIQSKWAVITGVLKRIDTASVYGAHRCRAIGNEKKCLSGLLYADTYFYPEPESHGVVKDIADLFKDVEKVQKDLSGLAEQKMVSLIAPSKGDGACDSKVWKAFCDKVDVVEKGNDKHFLSEVSSNVFGGAKLLNGKAQTARLESCESNAAVGILASAKPFSLQFAAAGAPAQTTPLPESLNPAITTVDVPAGKPIFVNFCRGIEITAKGAPVLFVQMWHPDVAPIERTTLIRASAKDNDAATRLAKLVNDASSKWEKLRRTWQTALKSLPEEAAQHPISAEGSELQGAKARKAKKQAEERAKADQAVSEEDKKAAVDKLAEQRAAKEEDKKPAKEETKKEEKKKTEDKKPTTKETKKEETKKGGKKKEEL